MSIGTIHPSKTLFLRTDVGEANDPVDSDLVYEMSLAGSTTPLIRSEKTGKWFSLSWHEIIDLAVEAGINDEEDES